MQGFGQSNENQEEDSTADSTRPLLVGGTGKGKGSRSRSSSRRFGNSGGKECMSVERSDSDIYRDGAGISESGGGGALGGAASVLTRDESAASTSSAAAADKTDGDRQSSYNQPHDKQADDKQSGEKPFKGEQSIIERSAAIIATPFRGLARGLLGVTGRAVKSFPTMHKRFKEDSAAAFRTAARIDDVCGAVLFLGYVISMIVIFTVY